MLELEVQGCMQLRHNSWSQEVHSLVSWSCGSSRLTLSLGWDLHEGFAWNEEDAERIFHASGKKERERTNTHGSITQQCGEAQLLTKSLSSRVRHGYLWGKVGSGKPSSKWSVLHRVFKDDKSLGRVLLTEAWNMMGNTKQFGSTTQRAWVEGRDSEGNAGGRRHRTLCDLFSLPQPRSLYIQKSLGVVCKSWLKP